MKVERYSLCAPTSGSRHSMLASCGNHSRTLFYLQRPGWIIDDAQWATICASVRLTLPPGFEVAEAPPPTTL